MTLHLLVLLLINNSKTIIKYGFAYFSLLVWWCLLFNFYIHSNIEKILINLFFIRGKCYFYIISHLLKLTSSYIFFLLIELSMICVFVCTYASCEGFMVDLLGNLTTDLTYLIHVYFITIKCIITIHCIFAICFQIVSETIFVCFACFPYHHLTCIFRVINYFWSLILF